MVWKHQKKTPTQGYCTKYPSSPLGNCHGHKKPGKNEKVAQTEGDLDVMFKCNTDWVLEPKLMRH